ncbi:hypothetical protein ACOSP7_026678 [Xanthoceras sorbifolium]
MAGLQYNFFPTDILYPRSSKTVTHEEAAVSATLPLQHFYFFPTDYLYPRPPPSLQSRLQIKRRDASHSLELPAASTITKTPFNEPQ